MRDLRLRASTTGIIDAQYRMGVTYKKTLNHPKAKEEENAI